MEATDAELLVAFARDQNEEAFRQLVRRHLGMVFATARRILGDSHQAEEISQTVFLLLADKAVTIGCDQHLAGWLYRAASHQAMHRRRSEGRRQQREQIAVAMHTSESNSPANNDLSGELEDALAELQSDERDALVLRFLEDRQLREVGHELGVSEEAARKRVSRALDRLREIFGQRGITASTGVLTALLVGQAGVAVPTTLGATITTAVAGASAAVATTAALTQGATNTMNFFNLKTAAAILATAAVTGTSTYITKQRQVDHLEATNQRLEDARAKLVNAQRDAAAAIQLRDEQIEELRKTSADVPRLRGEVDKLNRELGKVAGLESENRKLKSLNNIDREGIKNFDIIMEMANRVRQQRETFLKGEYIRLLGETLAFFASKHDGQYPNSLDAAKSMMGDKFYGSVRVMGTLIRADDFEICFTGNLNDLKEATTTKLIQEKIAVSYGQDKSYRVTLFGDGHISYVVEQLGPDGRWVVKDPYPVKGFE